jgi:hypothetical protein
MGKFRFGVHINTTQKKKGQRKLKYLRISAGPLRGQYVHRLIVAAKIGRPLTEDETVDHEDGNTLNDDPANLSEPISWAEHGRRTQARLKCKKQEAERLKKELKEEVPF